jgi:hypothetical protein
MRNIRFLLGLSGLLFLVGCAGLGIVATSDPMTKLNDAEHLIMVQNRPLPAEKLIFEAMEIYQKQDNSRGLVVRSLNNI